MTTLPLGNVVWRRFVSRQMVEWLKWARSVHLESHIRLWGKYVDNMDANDAAMKVLSNSGKDSEEMSLLTQFLLPDAKFWEELEELANTPDRIKKMYRVSLSATIRDVVYELGPYAQQFSEINLISDFLSSKTAWFEVLFDHFRGYQYHLLTQADKV
jgi:hypothetical protein